LVMSELTRVVHVVDTSKSYHIVDSASYLCSPVLAVIAVDAFVLALSAHR